ncbi:RDD family protein [Geobacillus subterraneus]|uniref:RDD family protein n=1 Tax=Geobacillus subterraneus TaxID=129338 RepID=UPI0035D05932
MAPPMDERRLSVEAAPRYGGFWLRFWAYLLDIVVVSSINRLIVWPLFRLFEWPLEREHLFAPAAVAAAVVFYAYFVLMTKAFGQTLGKMVFGLKVVDEQGEPLTWLTVLFREVVGKFIAKKLLFIGFLFVAFSEKKKGMHDQFADTIVIRD